MTTAQAKALIAQGPAATQAWWAHAQRIRCQENAPHHRYLVEARVSGKDKIIIDLGPCAHFQEAK